MKTNKSFNIEMDKFKKLNEESNVKVLNLQTELQEKDAQLVQAQISMTNLATEVNNFKTKDKSFEVFIYNIYL
jgi:hypothetical protein